MRSRFYLVVAGLATFLLGMPLAEKAVASDVETADIVGTSLDAAWAITMAALEAS